MASVEVPVRLYREATDQAWGFRLQGGDQGTPLSVLRVFAGGVADGHLNRGDQVVAIDNHNVTQLPLPHAEHLVSQAGRELLMVVKRQAVHHSPSVQHSGSSYPFQLGAVEDYDHAQNLEQLKSMFSHDEGFEPAIRGKVQINAKPGSVSYVPKKVNIFTKAPQKTPEFGWSPNVSSPHGPPHPPSHHHGPPHPSSNHHAPPRQPPVREVLSGTDHVSSYNLPPSHHESSEAPAWLGTLKSSSGLKPWEIQESNNILGAVSHYPTYPPQPPPSNQPHDNHYVLNDGALGAVHQPKVQVTKFSPNAITYGQQNPLNDAPSDTARVLHSQYNTPLGLYSASNANQMLNLQTADKPGAGTLKIVEHSDSKAYSPANSDVYRLIREEEQTRMAKRRGHNQQLHQPSHQPSTHQPSTHQPSTYPHAANQSAISNYNQAKLGVSDF